MSTMSCQSLRRLRCAHRIGLLIVGVVLATYLGLVTHAALHSPISGDTDCVYCGFAEQPEVAQVIVTPVIEVATGATHGLYTAPPPLAYRGYLFPVRGPPLAS